MDSDSDVNTLGDDLDELYLSEDLPEDDETFVASKLPVQQSSNRLSSFRYRPLRPEWYISDHFVSKARQLQLTVIPDFSLGELLVMLQHKKWLVDEVTSDFYDNWPKLRDACGLSDQRGVLHSIVKSKNFTCNICIEEGDMATFLVGCGHAFCAKCYSTHVLGVMARGSLITCLDPECSMTLLHEDIDKLVEFGAGSSRDKKTRTDEEQTQNGKPYDDDDYDTDSSEDEYDRHFQLMDLSNRCVSYTVDDPLLSSKALVCAARTSIDILFLLCRWCPSLDCNNLAEMVTDPRDSEFDHDTNIDISNIPIVSCPNSHEFCFDCQKENHLPCPCWIVKKWIQKCEDDSETANWMQLNTNSCPKCQARIEKNGGCEHMTCAKCRYEFCWICFRDWKGHGYHNCQGFNGPGATATRKNRAEAQQNLNRYLHYFRRFSVHQQSMEGDEATLQRVHRCMLLYMKSQRDSGSKIVSWNDVQFLSDALRSLAAGRKTLMWTYVFSFYLAQNNLCAILEQLQESLNKAANDLSKVFDDISRITAHDQVARSITLSKARILKMAASITSLREKLIECAYSELKLGSLKFCDY